VISLFYGNVIKHNFNLELREKKLYLLDALDFLMGCESYLSNRRISVSSICMYLTLKVVDVFSFHLQMFHEFIAPPSRRYFQGHSPSESPTPLPLYNAPFKIVNTYNYVHNIHFLLLRKH
jgi:hypothetical protein